MGKWLPVRPSLLCLNKFLPDMKDHLVVSFCLLVPVARNSSVYTQASMYVYLLYTLGKEAVEKEYVDESAHEFLLTLCWYLLLTIV